MIAVEQQHSLRLNGRMMRGMMFALKSQIPKPKDRRNTIRSNFGMADVYWLIVPRRK
jgi:hypothetical protein